MPEGERRLAAIMFTDLIGYTMLGQENESNSLDILEGYRKLLRPLFVKHGGHEIKTIGDAFLTEFESALQATECGVEIQRVLESHNETASRKLSVRIGIHVGDVVHRQGDVYGDAVNIASRIVPLAQGGEICISEQVYDQVHNKVPYRLLKLAPYNLKNVSFKTDVYKFELPRQTGGMGSNVPHDRNRLAILPLVNMSSDPNDEYFADGMTEEMISTLSNIGGLTVISRTSAMQYKGAKKNLVEIGRELGAGTLLEGSVRKAGNRVRITVQLLDASEDKHLWAQSYDRELVDVFAVQSDVATNVAEALKVRLLEREASQIRKKPTESIEAYTLYLKGRSLWNKRSKDGVLEALKLFEEAIKIDAAYARAYSGLADAYEIAASYDYMDWTEGRSKGREAATRALELDDTLPEAHASLGLILLYDLAFHEAQRELQRAIELNPSYASAHHWYSSCLAELGNMDEAADEIAKARELDPLSPVITNALAGTRLARGRVDEALAVLDKLLEREPTYAGGYSQRSFCFALKGMRDRALADWETFHKLNQDEESHKLGLACFNGWFGEKEEALRGIQDLLQETKGTPKYPGFVAVAYAILGEKDEFFSWVDRAIGMKRFSVWDLRYTPFVNKVKDDLRFPEIFKRLRLPYNQASGKLAALG